MRKREYVLYVCACMHVCASICVCTHMSTHVYMCVCIHACLCVFVCINISFKQSAQYVTTGKHNNHQTVLSVYRMNDMYILINNLVYFIGRFQMLATRPSPSWRVVFLLKVEM